MLQLGLAESSIRALMLRGGILAMQVSSRLAEWPAQDDLESIIDSTLNLHLRAADSGAATVVQGLELDRVVQNFSVTYAAEIFVKLRIACRHVLITKALSRDNHFPWRTCVVLREYLAC